MVSEASYKSPSQRKLEVHRQAAQAQDPTKMHATTGDVKAAAGVPVVPQTESDASSVRTPSDNGSRASEDVQHGVVQVAALNRSKNNDAPSANLQQTIQTLDAKMRQCGLVVTELGGSIMPWTAKKNKKAGKAAAGQLEQYRGELSAALHGAAEQLQAVQGKLAVTEAVLADKEKVITKMQPLETHLAARDAEVASLKQQLTELRQTKSQQEGQMKGMLVKMGSIKSIAAPAAAVNFKDEQIEQLNARVEQLVAEHTALQAAHHKLTRTKSDLAKKHKEVGDKLHNTSDVAERELRRLHAEIKRVTEAKEAELAAAKEQGAEALAAKARECQTLQKRYDALKNTAENVKESHRAAERKLEQVATSLTKSQEEASTLRGRAADMKASRDALAADLEQLRSEHSMLHADALAVGVKEAAVAAVQRFANTSASWPRRAYTTRTGRCVHNRACGAPVDTNKLQMFEYQDLRELEARVAEQGLFLCHACRAEPGF